MNPLLAGVAVLGACTGLLIWNSPRMARAVAARLLARALFVESMEAARLQNKELEAMEHQRWRREFGLEERLGEQVSE